VLYAVSKQFGKVKNFLDFHNSTFLDVQLPSAADSVSLYGRNYTVYVKSSLCYGQVNVKIDLYYISTCKVVEQLILYI